MNDYRCTGDRQDSCDCRPAPNPCPPPPPRPPQPEEDRCDCPCRRSLVQGLQMLLRTGLSNLVNFQAFGYLTPDFLVGAALEAPTTTTPPYDNLAATLTGSFIRFTPCACDYIDVTGEVNFPVVDDGAATGLTVSRLNLCDIMLLTFATVGDTAEAITESYQTARSLLQNLLRRPGGPEQMFPPYPDPCDAPCHWDCSRDMSVGGTTSQTVGPVLLAGVTVLGRIGSLQVLANDTDQRFYFVCTEDAVVIQ